MAPRGAVLIELRVCSLLGLLGLLGQENSLDVGQHTSLGDGNASQQLVQLLVIPDGQLKVTGDDSALLAVVL